MAFKAVTMLATASLLALSASCRAVFSDSARERDSVSAAVARSIPQVVPTIPPESANNKSSDARTGPLFRRTNFRSRYPADGGHASTGSSAR